LIQDFAHLGRHGSVEGSSHLEPVVSGGLMRGGSQGRRERPQNLPHHWARCDRSALTAGLISLKPWSTGDDAHFKPQVYDDEDDFEPPYDPREEEDRYWNELGYYTSLDLFEREPTGPEASKVLR
jgi:hypothetical protein